MASKKSYKKSPPTPKASSLKRSPKKSTKLSYKKSEKPSVSIKLSPSVPKYKTTGNCCCGSIACWCGWCVD